MPCCNRSGHVDGKTEAIQFSLEEIDLAVVWRRMDDATTVVGTSLRQLRRAERMEALGYEGAPHHEAALRSNSQAKRLVGSARAFLDDRIARDDWQELNHQFRAAFDEHDGVHAFADAKENFRYLLAVEDGVIAGDAKRAVDHFNQAFDRVAADGLEGLAELLKERLDQAAQVLESPELGRQPASPLTGWQLAACIGVASTLAAAAMLACILAPFCWCCFGSAVAASAVTAITACIIAPDLSPV
jgi:hypothetical protein